MFVRTIRGEYYPVQSIDRLFAVEDEHSRRVEQVQLKDGRIEQLPGGEMQRLLDSAALPFPALPDTFVLQEVLDDDNRVILERVPVLGWVVSAGRGVLPITMEGINHGLEGPAPVKMPLGEVVLAMTCTYANEQCYFAELRSRFKSD